MDWIIIFVKVCTFRAPLNLSCIHLQCPFLSACLCLLTLKPDKFSLSSNVTLKQCNRSNCVQNNEGAHRRHQHGHVLSERPEQFNVNRRQHTVTAGYKYQQSLSLTWWSERNERVLLDKIIAFLNCIFKMGYLKWKVIVFISNIYIIAVWLLLHIHMGLFWNALCCGYVC